MTTKQPHTIHPFYTAPDDETPLYAVTPDDGTRGYVIGELWEVELLRNKLNALLDSGTHDGEINHLHEQLGFKWLTTADAVELTAELGRELSRAMITHACRNGQIRNAEKAGRDWRFPQMNFLHWYKTRDTKAGPKPKSE